MTEPSAERVVQVCWNRREGPLPGDLREVVCDDCGRAVECQRDEAIDHEAITAVLERAQGAAIPHVCLSCAVARSRALPDGVCLTTVGASRAVAKFQELTGITEAQRRDAFKRGKAPEN